MRTWARPAASLLLRRTLSSSPAPRADQPSVGVVVVGLGRMGMIRAKALRDAQGIHLAAVVDPSAAARATFEARHPGVPAFSSLEACLGEVESGAVWCCTTTSLHERIITAAADCGKHVAVEKPVAASVEEIGRCYDACDQNRVSLYCSFQRRFDPAYVMLKKRCESLGPLASIHAIFRDHPMPSMEFLVRPFPAPPCLFMSTSMPLVSCISALASTIMRSSPTLDHLQWNSPKFLVSTMAQ